MITRLALLLALAATMAAVPAQAHCSTVAAHNVLTLEVIGGVTITIAEQGPPSAVFFPLPYDGLCDTEPSVGAPDGYLEIRQGTMLLCRNDDVDPSFDPFAFGAGLHDMAGDCGADFSAAGLTTLMLLDHAQASTDPAEPTLAVGTRREVATDVPGSYRWAGTTYPVPQDTPGISIRGVILRAEI